MSQPRIIVIAGPNGAGKSTAASHLIPKGLAFVNADETAKGLPGYPSWSADLQAGRMVLEQMDELERLRAEFAVETTLAGRSLAARIAQARRSGYFFRLIFLFLPGVDLAIQRVAGRVRLGGHNIPEGTIRRRYASGLKNFFGLYEPLADRWSVYDTAAGTRPRLIGGRTKGHSLRIREPALWARMREEAGDVV